MTRVRSCPRCKAEIGGYADACPSCGFEKPVPLPWHIYALMAVIFIAAMWFVVDLESIARAILAVRQGLEAM
jgi:hypothetical protein